jgi:putative tricarboxylic transport membrane protein
VIDKYRDVFSGVIMLLLAAGYLVGSLSIREYGDAAVNSRFFPQVLGWLLLVFSVLQLVVAIRNRASPRSGGNGREESAGGEEKAGRFCIKVIWTLLVILAYIFLIDILGFILSSTLFLMAQTMLMAPKEHRRPLFTLCVSAIFSVIIYAVFVYGFSLALPEGIFR